jgi:protein-tyrosine phosphatase
MLEDVVRENLKVIIESLALIEERFEKINSADDFVSNSHGTFVLDAISMRALKNCLDCRFYDFINIFEQRR